MTRSSSDYTDPRLTEQRNPRTERIDVASALEIVDLLNAEDATVAGAVHTVRGDVARAIDLVVGGSAGGGRLSIVGPARSGASACFARVECPRRFATRPERGGGVSAAGSRRR